MRNEHDKEKLTRLIWFMTEYYKGDAARIQHFTKVYTFCDWIASGETVDDATRYRLAVLALVHDIGIKAAIEKYGHYNAKLQEQEGLVVAEQVLSQMGFDPELVQRVSQIVGRHHTYTDIDGIDCQILIEADFLVNFREGSR